MNYLKIILLINENSTWPLFFLTTQYLFLTEVVTKTCTARAAALGRKNPQDYSKEKSIIMSSGRYLCIVYVKLRLKKNKIPSTE